MVLTTVYVHHNGYFAHPPNGTIQYVGGVVHQLMEETDDMRFGDLEHYAVCFDYERSNYLAYFQCDGHSFEKNVRALYDDDSIREMIEICLPYRSINLFIDHFDLEDLQTEHAEREEREERQNNGGEGSDELDDGDPDFIDDNQDDESEELEFNTDESDAELIENVRKMKIRKAAEANKMNAELRKKMMRERDDNSEESDYLSDEMRSLSSSSEDECQKKGYIGPPPPEKRKRKNVFYNPKKITDGGIKFSPGMRFGSMDEFRKAVRDYGIHERRAVQFNHNDIDRAQVVCEEKCPFYIWCRRLQDSETVEIRTLVDEHLCTKPYINKLASVKYLAEVYGDRIRKNPT